MDIMYSIAKTLSTAAEDDEKEEVWIEQQHFKDYKHCEDVYTKMMQDKSIEQLGNEFFTLVTQGKKLITGGFSRSGRSRKRERCKLNDSCNSSF